MAKTEIIFCVWGVCVCVLTVSPLLQIHAHYELKKSSRHRRNLAITGGVALSIITAPVIAAVSVGKKLWTRPSSVTESVRLEAKQTRAQFVYLPSHAAENKDTESKLNKKTPCFREIYAFTQRTVKAGQM